MPKVQELLKAANNDRDLGKGLNGDEANALGAAFEVRLLLPPCSAPLAGRGSLCSNAVGGCV